MPDYFQSGFCVRERSWHGKETLLEKAPDTWDEARLIAGLMWEPRAVTLYRRDLADAHSLGQVAALAEKAGLTALEAADFAQQLANAGIIGFVEEENGKRIERDDTGFGLGVTSKTLELITHADMGELMEPVLQQPGVRLDTMGAVNEGRDVYATVLLDEPYVIKGDVDAFGDEVVTLPYFAILNNHIGAGACKGLFTQVRVVCANTVQASAADGDSHGAQFSLRHTSGVRARLEEARDIVAQCRHEAERWRTMATELAATPITDEQQMQFLDLWIPVPSTETVRVGGDSIGKVSERQVANVERDRARFLHVLRESATNQAMQHNALGLFNAAVEWADHLRGFRNEESLLSRQILTAAPIKTQALRFVRTVAGVS